jgi:hypothetical protein
VPICPPNRPAAALVEPIANDLIEEGDAIIKKYEEVVGE